MKPLIYSIFIMALSSCQNSKDKPITQSPTLKENEVVLTDAQYKNAEIQTSYLSNNTMASILKVNGIIDVPPQNMVSISVPLGGYLRYTKLLPGMHINKGEMIAVIEDQQYIQLQQDYLLAKSKTHFASLEFNRQKELNNSQASSDKITQQAESELRNNEILLASLKQKLLLIGLNPNKISTSNISNKIFVTSPITGFVSKINVNIGKYVTPADILFELVNPNDIHLKLNVFEKDLSSLSIGQKVMAYTNSNPTQKYICEIILISKDITKDGTADVHCHFQSFSKSLLPGMYMNVDIELNQKNTNSLPEDAIVNFNGKDYIFLTESKNKFLMQEVHIGKTQNGFTEITNASTFLNKKIVTKGAYSILMKIKNTED